MIALPFDLEPLEAGGKRFEIVVVETRLRNSYAKLKEGHLLIKLPKRMSYDEKARVAATLYRRIKKAMEKKPLDSLLPHKKNLEFVDGQRIQPLGVPIEISIRREITRYKSSIKFDNTFGRLTVSVPENLPSKEVSRAIRLWISKSFLHRITARVNEFNDSNFRSDLGRISIKENNSNWGSCTHRNEIYLNFKLLFLPERVLDYVIIHELAHTRIRSHSEKFWALVASVMPDYRIQRRWLRDNGSSVQRLIGNNPKINQDAQIMGNL